MSVLTDQRQHCRGTHAQSSASQAWWLCGRVDGNKGGTNTLLLSATTQIVMVLLYNVFFASSYAARCCPAPHLPPLACPRFAAAPSLPLFTVSSRPLCTHFATAVLHHAWLCTVPRSARLLKLREISDTHLPVTMSRHVPHAWASNTSGMLLLTPLPQSDRLLKMRVISDALNVVSPLDWLAATDPAALPPDMWELDPAT